MKNFDSRTISINDLVEWDAAGQLELNPFFQRRDVWSDKAKSYLIDTILRGKPIPKIFIRHKLNVSTKTSIREIIDGQQRLRTILSYAKDGFAVSRQHNAEFGGLKFSQLSKDAQEQFLTFEISVDLLINMPDKEVLDIFSRLNSYAVTLNEQEKINANHFSGFRILADKIGHRYKDYWINQGLLTGNQVLRMLEVNLTADLLIAMIDGVRAKKRIKSFYDRYENEFSADADRLSTQFDETISTIGLLYPEGLKRTEFARVHLFYSLFTAVAHCLHGIKNLVDLQGVDLKDDKNIASARSGLDTVGTIFEAPDTDGLTRVQREFLQDSRRATTDEVVRVRRAKFLVGLMAGA